MLVSMSQYSSLSNLLFMCNILDPVTAERVVPVCYIFSVCNEGKRNACTDDLQWLNSESIIKNGSLLKNV